MRRRADRADARRQRTAPRLAAAGMAACLLVSGCGFNPMSGLQSSAAKEGFIGVAVADEPRAALAGRYVLANGGNAADAAAAMGFTLAVTLPSRAGLGGGGACIVYDPNVNGPGGGQPEAILFASQAPAKPGAADRPAGTPMVARGLFLLEARYGNKPIEQLIIPAEEMARFGIPMPRALARDLAVVAGPLSADPAARALFFRSGQPLAEGDKLVQTELAGTMSQLRLAGVGDLYQGLLARRLEEAMPSVGGGLTVEDMRASLPRVSPTITLPGQRLGLRGDTVSVLPPPFDGGLATAGAIQVLARTPDDFGGAMARASGLVAAARAGAANTPADLTRLLESPTPPGSPGTLPASTTFLALDRGGGAVLCAESMNNLFGTGRIAPGMGVLMSASPARAPQPELGLALVWNDNKHAFAAMAGGSGQEAAGVAAAYGVLSALAGQMPATPPDPGRANAVACPGYLPDNFRSCIWSVDPRSAGLAAGSE